MAEDAVKRKILDVLKRGFFSGQDDAVDVSDGADGCVHVVVVSRKFDGRRSRERHQLLWSELEKGLSEDEMGAISLSVARSPEEIKAGF
jgi:acid stress-induced BolA-like protein IbaG/YrbA